MAGRPAGRFRHDGVVAFRILAVCTGNVCRSPAIEGLLRAALPSVEVSSAGTGALVGHGVSAPMAALLEQAGALPENFAARQLNAELVRSADLVLTATAAHRGEVVQLVPAAVRRTFTARELGRLTAHVPAGSLPGATTAERLAALVATAPTFRAVAGPGPADIVDPWRRPDVVYRQAFDEIHAALAPLVAAVTGRSPTVER